MAPTISSVPKTENTGSEQLRKSEASEVPPPGGNGEFQSYWNTKAELPAIQALTSGRKAKLKARMAEPTFRDNWRQAVDKLALSPFHTGKSDSGWRANVDWLLNNDTNYVKILELPASGPVAVPLERDAGGKTPRERFLEQERMGG